MKVGALEIYWHPGTSTLRETVLQYLRDDPQVRDITARMARSEVKNYLAELAEDAEIPFGNPAGFLRGLRLRVTHWSTTGTRQTCECMCSECSSCLGEYLPENDAPFSVIDTLPNGHTTTCTCPDKDTS
jgi:hypothetical protein